MKMHTRLLAITPQESPSERVLHLACSTSKGIERRTYVPTNSRARGSDGKITGGC